MLDWSPRYGEPCMPSLHIVRLVFSYDIRPGDHARARRYFLLECLCEADKAVSLLYDRSSVLMPEAYMQVRRQRIHYDMRGTYISREGHL